MLKPPPNIAVCAARVLLAGNVQGVGYRPALAKLASACGLHGWVRNSAAGVEVHVEGARESLERFVESCEAVCPENGCVASKQVMSVAPARADAFHIVSASADDLAATPVPRDIVVCEACMEEVADASDRRHDYLLTTCSSCGPRYSMIARMPYERESTAMAGFALCPNCLAEYRSPSDRRFHAQSIACPDCGPLVSGISAALDCLADGKILAILGVGGYQLLVDARNAEAIARLRERKGRMSKPMAVMVADCQSAESIAEVSPAERQLLSSPQGPIVVLRQRHGALPDSLAPNLHSIGLMLPTTALHVWLARACGPLVVTSGNVEGEPLAYDPDEVKHRLASVADHFIDHDRPILRPIDDSVAREIAGRCATVRLARGFAPLPINVTVDPSTLRRLPHILALGGHQKAAIALSNGRQAILGPHIGDLDSLDTRERFVRHVIDMLQLYGAEPTVVVHDAHPDYFTSQWAEEYCRRTGARRIAVQHHHAHIAAGLVEHGWLERQVLGIAWDGTGFGSDGTLWGGEFFLATATEFQRTACLRPLSLPGGEAAIRQPWRIAAAMLHELGKSAASAMQRFPGQAQIERIANHRQLSPLSTSIGRLFDAVAALVLPDPEIRLGTIGYEGHFAAMLEDVCHADAQGAYPFLVLTHEDQLPPVQQLDWRPLLVGVLRDLDLQVPRGDIAMRFHRSLAGGIAQISSLHPDLPVVLGGGVFQNKMLVELVNEKMSGREFAFPGTIPANDGGLAAGQLAVACAQLERERCV
ncbi:MAG: carbamoyltransferase HypF [Aureliella sp.]